MIARGIPFSDEQLKGLGDFCRSQNGQFKRERWLAYINGDCGPNGGKIKHEEAISA